MSLQLFLAFIRSDNIAVHQRPRAPHGASPPTVQQVNKPLGLRGITHVSARSQL